MKSAYQAILAAADHIERHPELYCFGIGLVPKHPGTPACMLARIGQFAGVGHFYHWDVAEWLHTNSYQFYLDVAFADFDTPPPYYAVCIMYHVVQNPALVPRLLRIVAERYKPAEVPAIPAMVREIFEEPVATPQLDAVL